jgi:hypothetical protein
MNRALSVLLAGLLAGATIFAEHARMVPDFYSYAKGGSCWSSMTTCAAGHIGGSVGVEIYAFLGSIACGLVISSPLAFLLIAISPVGQGISNAGADSLGAAVFSASKKKVGSVLLLCAVHLVCGLYVLCVLAARKLRVNEKIAALVAGVGAIVAMYVISQVRGIPYSGVQWRYLLPPVLYATRITQTRDCSKDSRGRQ